MSDNNNDIDDDFLSYEDDLLHSVTSGFRILVLERDHKSVPCILLEETTDSFLIAIPCELLVSGKDQDSPIYTIRRVSEAPYMRVLKSSIFAVVPIFGVIESNYKKFIYENGVSIYPELDELIEDLKLEDAASAELGSVNPSAENTSKNNNLEDYLATKVLSGEFTYGPDTKQ